MSTLLPLQEIGQNEHEKGGWAYNASWAYNTYSTVYQERPTYVSREVAPSYRFRIYTQYKQQNPNMMDLSIPHLDLIVT